MTEAEVAAKLGLEAINAGEGTREIKGIYAGDLLSRVMSHAKAGNFWVTIMANPNTVAVAMLLRQPFLLLLIAFTMVMSSVSVIIAPAEVSYSLHPQDAPIECVAIEFDYVREGGIYDDGTLKVSAMPTGHMENAYAFLIESEGKTLLFTGDMKHKDGPISDFARFVTKDGLDLAVAEGAHFDVMLYQEPLRAHPPKLFCINHYNQWQTAACWQLKRALEPDIPTLIATDGLEIKL